MDVPLLTDRLRLLTEEAELRTFAGGQSPDDSLWTGERELDPVPDGLFPVLPFSGCSPLTWTWTPGRIGHL